MRFWGRAGVTLMVGAGIGLVTLLGCAPAPSLPPGRVSAAQIPDETSTSLAAVDQATPKVAQPPVRDPELGSGKPITIAFGGDVNFEGGLAGALQSDPASLLSDVQPLWADADIVMVNLETAITERGTRPTRSSSSERRPQPSPRCKRTASVS